MTTASFTSQYIRNYTEDTPVSNRPVKAFVDGNHKPVVFTHGSDDQLYAIVQRDGQAGGWRRVNLTASLAPGCVLTAYDVYQDRKSQSIRLCAGLKTETNDSALYVTALLNAKSFAEDGFPPEKFWQQIDAPRDETIDHILVDAREGFITTSKQGQDARYYRIDENHRRTEYHLAENVKQIQDIRLGRWEGLPGLFFLCMVGSQQTVSFYGFPEPEFPEDVYTIRFAHDGPGRIDGFALVESDGPGHDLYMIGEDGLFRFHNVSGKKAERTVILESKSDISFRNLQFSQHGDALSCWFVDSSNKKLLYYMYSNNITPATGRREWSVPLALKSNVEQYACVRGTGIRNHLFYVDNAARLYHFFEDEISSLWHDNFVPLDGTGTFKESAGYLTEVSFTDHASSQELQDAVVTLTSPVNLYISVDLAFYQIGPDLPITIPLNGRESLYLSHTLNSGFVDAVLCLRAGFLKEPLAIDMAKSIYDKLEELAQSNLRGMETWTRRDGITPLLPDDYRNKEDARQKIAEALQFLVDFRKDCRNDNICGVDFRSLLADSSAGMFQETMTLSLTGVAEGAAIGGIAGAAAFMGGALLIPKDPVSEGVLVAGTLICALIGAIIGGAIGWTLELVKKRKPIDDGNEPEEPPKECPGLIFTRIGCKGTLTLYSKHCDKAISDLDVSHMFSSINMLLAFVGITPSDLPDWPTDNDKCVYHGYLI